ncbi:hypothetical protein ABW21_db0204160 [Orbilia brochopaga]|nr:hypothetical protein ABW21_db0204160 [Drechslerella brochopaga]
MHRSIPAIRVKTPEAVFSGYLDSQGAALRALGDEIDYFKRIKEISCPVGGEDDVDGHGDAYPYSLQFYIDVLHRGFIKFDSFVDSLKFLSTQQALQRLMDRFGIAGFEQASQFQHDLFERYESLRTYPVTFIKYSRGVNRVPGRLTPLNKPEAQNLVRLVGRIEKAGRDGQGSIEFDTDGRESWLDEWDVLAGYANGGSLKMQDAQQWAIDNLMKEGFLSLVIDMDPNISEAADSTPEDSSPGESSPNVEQTGLEEERAETFEEEMEGFAGEEVQLVLQANNNMEVEVAPQSESDSSDDADDDGNQDGGVVFDFAEVFRRADLWFQCWRDQAVRIYQRTNEIEPVPYPPQFIDILEEDA